MTIHNPVVVVTLCLLAIVTLTSGVYLNTTKKVIDYRQLSPAEITEPDGDGLWSTLLEEWTMK